MRVAKEDCFVLRTVPFTESSLLVDAFTRGHGRLNLLAKGARRSKSRLRGYLQPFQLLSVGWSGKGALPVINAVERAGLNLDVSGERFYSANYLSELVVRYLHGHDAHPDLFDAYLLSIRQIVSEPEPVRALRIFEKRLLIELGYGLALETEADGGAPILEDRHYDYDFERGPVQVEVAGPQSVSGHALLALAKEDLQTRRAMRESRQLLSRALEWHFAGRTMHSRDVYRQTLQEFEDDAAASTSCAES